MKALGIDLGTTKVAVIVYDSETATSVAINSPHYAALNCQDQTVFEQDVCKIAACTEQLIAQLPKDLRQSISAVGITGQMHSLLLKSASGVSPLITWQDHRCGADRIEKFNRLSGLNLREGFGGTTLARLSADNQLPADKTLQASTISDYLAALLTGNDFIVTDPTHAASWGIYDTAGKCWNQPALKALNIPMEILPEIRPSGAVIGHISAEYSRKFALPEDAVVINALGDNQASILGTGKDFDHEIYLTLGTGAQLSMTTLQIPTQLPENIEVRPFPGGRHLLVSAPLCGGAAFAMLADTVNSFRTALGEEPLPRKQLMDKLDALGMEYIRQNGEPELCIKPHFLGERHAPELRGTLSGLTLDNATPGALAAALAWGIVRNLKANFPPEELAQRTTVIGSGNAVRLVKSIQHAIKTEFNLPLQLSDKQEEAATGAAQLALQALTQAC